MIKYAALLLFMLSPVWHCVPDVQQDPLRARDSMVYMVVIDALDDADDAHVVVLDSTAQFALPDGASRPGAQAVGDSFPPDLVAKLVEQSRQRRPSATLPLRNRTLITRTQLAEIFRGGWPAFHSRYPFASGFLSLSPVVWSATGTTALVYFEWSCGELCGAGALLLVERTREEWRIIRDWTFWQS